MNKGQVNLQDTFLNQVRKENIAVTIYLIGGVQLRGQVRGFDTFTILLDSPGRATPLVYQTAATTLARLRTAASAPSPACGPAGTAPPGSSTRAPSPASCRCGP